MTHPDRTTPPKISSFGRLTIPEPRHSTLDNDIPTTIVDQSTDDICLLSIVWQGGLAEAPSPKVATLTALTMREGTTNRSGAEIAETLEYNGAQLAIMPSTHFTRIDLTVLNSRLEYVLPVIADIFCNPTYPERELHVLRENQARNLEIEREKVDFQAVTMMNRLIMGENNPLAVESLPEHIRATSRDSVISFWVSVFKAAPVHIYLAGKISPQVENLVNHHIGSIKFDHSPLKLNIVPFSPSERQSAVITRDESLQSAVRLAIPTIGRDNPDYTALRLLIMALGGYFGSRLMLNLREDKGYTYGIQAHLLGFREGGIMMINTECDNSYVAPLIEEVKNEINRLASGDFTETEVERLRFNAMSQLASMLDTPFSIADYYRNHLLSNTPSDYFDCQQDAIAALSPSRLASLARHLNISRLYTVIAGNPQ